MKPGVIRFRDEVRVGSKDSASQWGNEGLEVLSTPAILGTMERVCVDALADHLEPGEMTVGTGVDMTHEASAAVGETVRYEISAVAEGRRIHVTFVVSRLDGTVVSKGNHERFAVDAERFVARLAATRQ